LPASSLRKHDVEKSVMFDVTTISIRSAKRHRKYSKLSEEDKIALYSARPDLNPDYIDEPLLSRMENVQHHPLVVDTTNQPKTVDTLPLSRCSSSFPSIGKCPIETITSGVHHV
jgi:hypothetical protein